jgi:hypothetical protein
MHLNERSSAGLAAKKIIIILCLFISSFGDTVRKVNLITQPYMHTTKW